MAYLPGTHTADQIPHRDTFDANNLLTRGQEVMVDVDASRQVVIDLEPGEMSLHHVRLVHGSPPNPSDDRRIGLAIRYLPTSVKQIAALTARRWCVAWTPTATSSTSPGRRVTWTPNLSRCINA